MSFKESMKISAFLTAGGYTVGCMGVGFFYLQVEFYKEGLLPQVVFGIGFFWLLISILFYIASDERREDAT